MASSLRCPSPQSLKNIPVASSDPQNANTHNHTAHGPVARILNTDTISGNHEGPVLQTPSLLTVETHNVNRDVLAYTSNLNILADPLTARHSPSTKSPRVDEYLQSKFAHEAEVLALLLNPCFGKAYQHYTRYIILSHICLMTGLDFHRPSSQGTVLLDHPHNTVRMTIKHAEVIEWARLKWGNIANRKKIIVQAERARLALEQTTNIAFKQAHLDLLHCLLILAGKQGDAAFYFASKPEDRPAPLGWNLTQLNEQTKAWA